MSEENVEVVWRAIEAMNAGDMDALRKQFDADAIGRPAEGWPERGPFVGREAVMRWWEQLQEAFDMSAIEPISYSGTAEHVVLRFIWHGMGRGPEANLEFSGVVTVRKGRVVLTEFFWDHAEALEAAGLSE